MQLVRLAALMCGLLLSAFASAAGNGLNASIGNSKILNSELKPATQRSPAYLMKLGAHIKRFIVYVARNGEERALNPLARFRIKVSPTGEILSVQLIQTSGYKNWDLTAARAIEQSNPLPLPEEGGPPEEFEILMRPKEET